MLEYAYNWQISIENCQNIVCEYNWTDIAGETLRKIKPGSGFYFENSMFHSLPLLHLKGYQPDSFSYRFLKVSKVFRHSFRLLFWKMSQNDNIASSGHMSFDRYCFSLSYCKRHLRLIYYWLYILKTTWGLIIKNVWHFSVDIMETIWNFRLRCRDRSFLWISEHNTTNKLRYFGYKNNIFGTKGTFVV